MASSSVSQEDMEADYEKLERRSRIRTARARQINPQGGCRLESGASDRFPGPSSLPTIGIEIDEGPELHGPLDPVSISPYSHGEGGDTSPKRGMTREALAGTQGGKKDSIRGNHPKNLMHHGNKGKQQRDRRKLREKRRSTGVVHLASTESTGGSTTEGEEVVEDLCSETKRNTAQNESLGESPLATVSLSGSCEGRTSPVHQPAGHELPQPVERRNSGRLGSQPHHPQYTSAYTRPRLRDKSPRSEDLEADDEQGDKTDNDHDSLNLSESSSVTTVREQPPQATTASLQPAEQPTVNSSTSTPVLRPTTPTLGEPEPNSQELVRQLQEKDRRIQFLEVKIQQLTQDTDAVREEQRRLQRVNQELLAALSLRSKDA
jgi:hypothetical protein